MDKHEEVRLTKELLKTVRHAAMATVNEDGSPHNTPYFFMYSPDFTKLYWGSHPDSRHSQNIQRSGQLFVVVFDSFTPHKGGLYITAVNGHEVAGEELTEALKVHNAFRAKYGKEPLDEAYYAEGEQRMYSADVQKMEVHTTVRDGAGHIIKETRVEVNAEDLAV